MEELNNFKNLYSLEEPDYVEIGDENNFDEPDYVEIDVNTSEYENIEENINYSEEPEYINFFNDGNSSNVNNSPQTRAGTIPGACGCHTFQTPTTGTTCPANCGCHGYQDCNCHGYNSGTGGAPLTTYVSIIFSVKISLIFFYLATK